MSIFCGVISKPDPPNPPQHPREKYIDWNDLELIVDYLIDETRNACNVFHNQRTEFIEREKIFVYNLMQIEVCANYLSQLVELYNRTEMEMCFLTLEINCIEEFVNSLETKPKQIIWGCREENEHDRLYKNLISLSASMSTLENNIEQMMCKIPSYPIPIAFFHNVMKYLGITLQALENTEKNLAALKGMTENIENLMKRIPKTQCPTKRN